jgi:Fur family transcriptional regulator, zinc uptake regulator
MPKQHSPKPHNPKPHSHDHRACVRDALSAARQLCGARLTPVRQRVLELIWASHKPIGAYAILESLSRERGPTAPPTVYRALEFLTVNGLAHRIDSANAYIGCAHPQEIGHASQFLLCTDCGEATELESGNVALEIQREARRRGFAVTSQSIEVHGRCPDCGQGHAHGG